MESIGTLYWGFAQRRKGRRLSMSVLAHLIFLLAAVSSTFEHATATTPLRLLVLGDSLSAGYGLAHADGFESQLQAALKANGRDVTILDGAVSGDTSAGGRARLDWALGDGADAAIVELGANDGLRGVDPKDMEANLTAILDELASRRIPVLLAGMYRAAQPGTGLPTGVPRRVRPSRRTAGRAVTIPSFWRAWRPIPGLNQADGMHPNPDGVRRIVARLLPLVEKLLAEAKPG